MEKENKPLRAKQKLLENLKNTYCRLKPSKIEGVGVFAIRDIPEGINPIFGVEKQSWIKLNIKELESLDKEILDMIDSFYVIEKDGSVYISKHGLNSIDPSYFFNNSKNPNMKTIDGGENFITSKKIKKGEELTVSYATYDEKYK